MLRQSTSARGSVSSAAANDVAGSAIAQSHSATPAAGTLSMPTSMGGLQSLEGMFQDSTMALEFAKKYPH